MTAAWLREACERAIILNRSLDMPPEAATVTIEVPGPRRRKAQFYRLAPGGPRGRFSADRTRFGGPLLVRFSCSDILGWLNRKETKA